MPGPIDPREKSTGFAANKLLVVLREHGALPSQQPSTTSLPIAVVPTRTRSSLARVRVVSVRLAGR
jgi:hypothetical protein